jgi:hypothetical protein
MNKLLTLLILVSASCNAATHVGSLVADTVSRQSVEWSDYLANKQIDVVLLMGQSNAVGYPNDGNYYTNSMPAYLKAYQTNVLAWVKTQQVAWTGEYLHPTSWQYWGSELSMLYGIQQGHARKVALCKVACGSTDLAEEWQKDNPTGAPYMYDFAADYYTNCIAGLEALGLIPTPRMFIWTQGEDDTTTESWATNYYANYVQMWGDFCADTGVPTNLATRLAPLPPYYNGAGYGPEVRQAQTNLVNDFPHIDWLDVSGTAHGGDGVHYSPASLILIGERAATNYLSQFSAPPLEEATTSGTFIDGVGQ